jgi:hypothetical protein
MVIIINISPGEYYIRSAPGLMLCGDGPQVGRLGLGERGHRSLEPPRQDIRSRSIRDCGGNQGLLKATDVWLSFRINQPCRTTRYSTSLGIAAIAPTSGGAPGLICWLSGPPLRLPGGDTVL